MMQKSIDQIRLLIVCSKNSGKFAPFILDQAAALERAGVKLEFFGVEGKGWSGYLQNRKHLLNQIATFKPDLIHAHYGLSGLLANLQRKVPVVTTYHGSDINDKKVFRFSKLAILLSKHNIFVSKKNLEKAKLKNRFSLLPCGVDLDFFKPIPKKTAREKMGLPLKDKMVLFSGSFNNQVKNAYLAHQAIELLHAAYLIELRNYSREQVCWLMNAADACIMTSRTEGSPQFIKEAMACNCPVVSVEVGDVAEVMGDTDGCFIADYTPEDLAGKLELAVKRKKTMGGRQRLIELNLDNQIIATHLIQIYSNLIQKK